MNTIAFRGVYGALRSCHAPLPTVSRILSTSTRTAFRTGRFNHTSAELGTARLNAYGRIGVVASIAALGLGVSSFKDDSIACQEPAVAPAAASREPLPPPPASSVNVYELSFGTVCGICAGVFLKKGAKALAFLFGGVFVLLQYFTSLSLLRVDWGRFASRFENLFYSPPTEAGGPRRPPSLLSLWNWFINFLTADFQQRASFVAGFALGLRLG